MYPADNSPSRPLIQFRVRYPDADHPAGHIFVFLGRELSDGTKVWYGAGGFYPDETSQSTALTYVKEMLFYPGHVDYTVDDLSTDALFEAKITGEQENIVRFVMSNWNEKRYNLAIQNCVSLSHIVAKVTGLDLGDNFFWFPTPGVVMDYLKNHNDVDKPLRHAIEEGKRIEAVRKQDGANLKEIRQHLSDLATEVAQSQESWDRFIGTTSQWSAGIPFSPSPGTSGVSGGDNPFSIFTYEHSTWPWRPPNP